MGCWIPGQPVTSLCLAYRVAERAQRRTKKFTHKFLIPSPPVAWLCQQCRGPAGPQNWADTSSQGWGLGRTRGKGRNWGERKPGGGWGGIKHMPCMLRPGLPSATLAAPRCFLDLMFPSDLRTFARLGPLPRIPFLLILQPIKLHCYFSPLYLSVSQTI